MTRIVFFGRLRDQAGCSEIVLDWNGTTVAELIEIIARDSAELGEALRHASVRIAADHEFVSRDASLSQAEEIAFMSPLSGG